MRRPVNAPYTITTEFGEPDSNSLFGYHSGVDYAVAEGTEVHAPIAGTVTYAQFHNVRGNMVGIFDGTYTHRLMHNSQFKVSVGQQVSEGQVVALSGTTGLSTGPHVHWDIMSGNRMDANAFSDFIDPFEWLNSTPPPAPAPVVDVLQSYQRRVRSDDSINYRDQPSRNGNILATWPVNDLADFKGWVHGEAVDGNDIWFVGRYTGGYAWSGGFTDPSTSGLTDMNPPSAPTPPASTPVTPPSTPPPAPVDNPAPSPGTVVTPQFSPDSEYVTRVVASKNFMNQTIDPQYIVIHQWDDPAKKPLLQGVLNQFLATSPGLAPHYVVNDAETIQMVPESKRAQHAGPEGNNHIGIEFDPNGTELMYIRGQALIRDIRARHGKDLPLKGHNYFMATECPKYIKMSSLEPLSSPLPANDLEQRIAALEDFKTKMVQFFKNQ